MGRHKLAAQHKMARYSWRRWTVGLALIAGLALLLVACSGGAASKSTLYGAPADGGAAQPATSAKDLAPDFEIPLFQNENHAAGEVLHLSQLQGHPVVVNFWYPTCPPCRAEMPELEQSFKKHKAQGVEFVGVQQIALDSAEDGQNFIREYGITYAVGTDADGSILLDYNVVGFPTTVFLDADHRIVRKWTGPLNLEKLDELVQELLN